MTLFPLAHGYPAGAEGEAIYREWLAERDQIYADHLAAMTIGDTVTTDTDTETEGPRPDAPDTERTDTAAFAGKASVELEVGREQQAAEQQTAEDAPEPEPENTDANDDDATPPDFNPDAEPEPEPDAEDAGDAA